MKIVFTAFTARCLENWAPLIDLVRKKGGQCDYVLFPRVSDPNHVGLLKISDGVLICESIGEDFGFLERTSSSVMADFSAVAEGYDAVLMSSCVAGPELALKKSVRGARRPIFVGLQHGFSQHWDVYEKEFDSFDFFGVFGSRFVAEFSVERQSKVMPLGLPKLDQIPRRSGFWRLMRNLGMGRPRVLFALQSWVPVSDVRSVCQGFKSAGYSVTLRPHPEHVFVYDELRQEGFDFSGPGVSFLDSLSHADVFVSSGSTAILEAISAGVPSVVIPEQYGDAYAEFGVVADSMRIDDVLRVLSKYSDPLFLQRLNGVFAEYAGPIGKRSEFAYDSLEKCIASANG